MPPVHPNPPARPRADRLPRPRLGRPGEAERRHPRRQTARGAIVLFDGKGLDGWVKQDGKTPAEWPVADGIVTVGRGDIQHQKFGDFKLHLEFNVPYMPQARGQGRGNSGVYLGGIHELQVLDSYGLKSKNNDCGAIYQQVSRR